MRGLILVCVLLLAGLALADPQDITEPGLNREDLGQVTVPAVS